jgi:hypothetical protein
MDGLDVVPELRAVAQVRRASSGCCAAKLNIGAAGQGTWECRACGKPCDRIMSETEEVELHG